MSDAQPLRPRIFIGSSSEALPVAHALQANLDGYADVTVWTQGVFMLSKTTIEALLDAVADTDCAVFVLNGDDVSQMRGTTVATTRDNVIFELGLCIGALGRWSTFLVVPKGVSDLHLPSDLLGISAATYRLDRADANLVAALGPAAMQIRQAIARRPARGK
jgi:predicted nucleotide-binding protein